VYIKNKKRVHRQAKKVERRSWFSFWKRFTKPGMPHGDGTRFST